MLALALAATLAILTPDRPLPAGQQAITATESTVTKTARDWLALVDEQDIPAPPNGYRTVRFRTDFAHKRGAIETLSLEQDGPAWRIAGVYIE